MTKFTERMVIYVEPEMRRWISTLVREGNFNSQQAVVRALLQTIMDEDMREHEEKAA